MVAGATAVPRKPAKMCTEKAWLARSCDTSCDRIA